MISTPEQFAVHFADDILDDLRDRLRRTRWSDNFGNDDWSYGVNGDYLRGLADYWADGFDWRAQERAINRFEQYRVTLDGVPIHYLMRRGKRAEGVPPPMPLILTHGWPWTFWDYRHVIEPLADPAAHGGDPADAFDVIVPSLPGFGFSTPLRQTGVGYLRTADLWHQLMTQVLGYPRYGAQGGDWGAIVTSQLSHKYAEHMTGIHVSLPVWPGVFSGPRPFDLLGGIVGSLPPEVARTAIAAERTLASHITAHILDPQTLSYGLADSPVGMLAWLLERWRAWSDCGGDVETRFSRDDILTSATIYWATQSIGTSIRYYAEAARVPWVPSHDRSPAFAAPAGVTVFRADPTSLFADGNLANYNLHYLVERHTGGHFAAAEEPAALVEDIRATFRDLR